MTSPVAEHEHFPDTHHDTYSRTIFGFWLYLITDFILFATLFASYLVLQRSTFGGPSIKDLAHFPFTLTETLILLTSSFTCGLAGAYAHRRDKKWTIVFFLITVLLGIVFLSMQIAEFVEYLSVGYSWKISAFLSAFFTLVGTHAAHIVFAILWTIVLLPSVFRDGITAPSLRRLVCLKMFWQFLNIIWVFIFTIVYLTGGKLG